MKRRRLRLSNLTDDDLIRIGQDKEDRYDLDTRVRAREMLKARGYRFVGGRLEKDEQNKLFHREDIMEERTLKGGHRQCKHESCDKYTVRDGFCAKHFKEQHGYTPYSLNAQNHHPCSYPRCGYQSLPGLDRCKRHKNKVQEIEKQTPTGAEIAGIFFADAKRPEHATAPKSLTIDFTGYPQLYEGLVKDAQKQFRTPEMQMLVLISAAVSDRCT